LVALDPNVRQPKTLQWNAAWEQQLGDSKTVTATYVGASGRALLLTQNYYQSISPWNLAIPLAVERNLAKSKYNAMQLQAKWQVIRRLQVMASYSLAKSVDNASAQAATSAPASEPELLAQEWGPSDYDVRHQLSGAVSFEIPTPSAPAVVRRFATNWGLDVLIRAQSAPPVTPLSDVYFASASDGYTYQARPNLVSGQPLYLYDPTLPGGRRFNPEAFVAAPLGEQGTFPRNGLRGFPSTQLDLSLRRDVDIRGRTKLQIRCDLFNALNHPMFGQPNASIVSPLFGQPTTTLNNALGGLNALYQVGGPRSGQVSLKVLF
jgi:hypothetical protein